jgi:hypothetical protein
VTSWVYAYIPLHTFPTRPPVMRFLRPEYVDEDTWAQLPEKAQHWLDATLKNQRDAQENEELVYQVYGEPAPPDHNLQATYAS